LVRSRDAQAATMTALITGVAGFIGRHLASALLAGGERVVGVDNFITSDRVDLETLLRDPGFEFHELDVATGAVERFTAGLAVDQVYHLACPTGVPNLGPLAAEMLETCFFGTRTVLELARTNRARVLLSSSAEVYGNPTVSPQDEAYTGNVDPLGARKGYEEGKRVAETLMGIYAERYGVHATIVRIFNTYGPGMSLRDTRVIPSFVRAALSGTPLRVHGDGSQLRCHAYVADIVDGIRKAAELGAPGRAYNLGSERAMSIGALAALVVSLTGGAGQLEHVGRPSHDHDARLPAIGRAGAELGWRPATPLELGLEATIADFRVRMGRAGAVAATGTHA
jgi:UDP-glucuronate decarboxylase